MVSSYLKKFLRLAKQYRASLAIFIVYITVIAYPAVVSYYNPAPDVDRLREVSVMILKNEVRDPKVHIVMPDGAVLDALLSTNNYDPLRGFGHSLLHVETLSALNKGCTASVRYDETKLTPSRYFRLWDIKCGSIHIEYEKLKPIFDHVRRFSFVIDAFENIFCISIFGLLIFSDWRKL